MTSMSLVARLIAGQLRRRRFSLFLAGLGGAAALAGAVLLLGLSGWFLAGAAAAGAGGALAAQAFNYVLPSAGLRGLAIARTVGRYGERLYSHQAAFRALAALRPALFAGLAASPPERALSLSTGEASARLVGDVNAVETAFVRVSAPFAALAGAGAASVVIALASPLAAAAFIGGLCLQLALGTAITRRSSRDAGRDQLRAAGRLKDALAAYLAAAPELKCFNLTPRAISALMTHDAELGVAGLRRSDADALLGLVQAGAQGVTVLLVVLLVIKAPPAMAALAALAALAGGEALAGLLSAAERDGAYREAVERLDGVMGEALPAAAPPPPSARLEINGVHLAAGARLGVQGRSGCGKTRTLEALIGLRSSPPGSIRIDGRPLEDAALGWARPLFAFSPQDARLITGAVAENLRLAAPEASDAELWDVLADAQLEARIRRMPSGLETWIGDGGETLSGGERKRLSLARALLRPAPWLVLDEPTEGLDRTTETALLGALERRLARTGQGLILVSHRPAPRALCGKILTLDAPAGPTGGSLDGAPPLGPALLDQAPPLALTSPKKRRGSH